MDLRKSIRIALFGPVSAGKSTLLSVLSEAKPEIGPWPTSF